MDVGALATAFVGAQMGQVQMAVAAKMLKMSFDSAKSVLTLIDAAQQSTNNLANVAAGVGSNLDITA